MFTDLKLQALGVFIPIIPSIVWSEMSIHHKVCCCITPVWNFSFWNADINGLVQEIHNSRAWAPFLHLTINNIYMLHVHAWLLHLQYNYNGVITLKKVCLQSCTKPVVYKYINIQPGGTASMVRYHTRPSSNNSHVVHGNTEFKISQPFKASITCIYTIGAPVLRYHKFILKHTKAHVKIKTILPGRGFSYRYDRSDIVKSLLRNLSIFS